MKKMDVRLEKVNQSGVSPTFLHICFHFISFFLPLSDLYLLVLCPYFPLHRFLKTFEETRKFLFPSSVTDVCPVELSFPSPLDHLVNFLFQ